MENINLQVKRIAFAEIDFNDQTYRLRPGSGDDLPVSLLSSIKKFGILSPPILQDKEDAGYIILAGRQRLSAGRDIRQSGYCNCLVVPRGTSDLACLELVREEGDLAAWSPIMRMNYLRKVAAIIGLPQTAADFLPPLGLTPQIYHLEKILALADLEEPLIMAIHQGDVAEKTAYELSRLPFRDRLTILDLINGLRLSVSNQRQLITICADLAKRASTSIHAILNDKEILDIIHQGGQNIPQQTAKLMKKLQERRSPRLAEARQEFNAWQHGLNLPGWASVSHASSFETDQVSLHLNFANQERLAEFCRKWLKV